MRHDAPVNRHKFKGVNCMHHVDWVTVFFVVGFGVVPGILFTVAFIKARKHKE